MTAPAIGMTPARSRALGSRLRNFWRRPWFEKIFVVCNRIRMSFPRFPAPLRLPFGAWWLIRGGALDNDLASGTFEAAELRLTERLLKPGMIVLDIGANHGLYTLLASRCVGAQGSVFAFEPSPRELKRLRTHLWLNRCANVRIFACALGSRAAQADLHVVYGSLLGCNSLRPPQVNETVATTRVEVRTLDDFLECEKLQRVDFIKMDVEGGELEVLKGAQKLFQGPRLPVLLVEVSDLRTAAWNYKARQIVLFLQVTGYDLFSVTEDGSLVPASASGEFMDANLIALPKSERRQSSEDLHVVPDDNGVRQVAR